jgi:hypothetical protein
MIGSQAGIVMRAAELVRRRRRKVLMLARNGWRSWAVQHMQQTRAADTKRAGCMRQASASGILCWHSSAKKQECKNVFLSFVSFPSCLYLFCTFDPFAMALYTRINFGKHQSGDVLLKTALENR